MVKMVMIIDYLNSQSSIIIIILWFLYLHCSPKILMYVQLSVLA